MDEKKIIDKFDWCDEPRDNTRVIIRQNYIIMQLLNEISNKIKDEN